MSRMTPEVDVYLEDLVPERRAALSELRSLVFEAVPGVIETVKYRMPTYEYDGEVLCAFASQKHYMSLYMDTGLVEAHRGELAGLSVGKSCIRFRKLEMLPLDTARAILLETLAQKRSV